MIKETRRYPSLPSFVRIEDKLKVRIIIGAAFLLMSGCVHGSVCNASSGDIGTSSGKFLKLGFGARAAAMGGAFVGLADDASAIYWNPAGLASIKTAELSFMHLAWFQDISYEYFAHAQPVGRWGVFGWSVAYLHMDKLKGRDQQGRPTSDFAASDMAITFAFGRSITNSLLFGGSIKSIDEKIEEQSAYGLAFDFGCLVQTPLENLFLGGIIQNLGKDIKFVEESFELPTNLKLGASYRHTMAGNPINLTADFFFPSDGKTNLHWGTEYVYKNAIAARVGYQNGSDLGTNSGLSLGLGLAVARTQTYKVDYAFVPKGILGDSHTFSLSISF
jgi:hypothetical protein